MISEVDVAKKCYQIWHKVAKAPKKCYQMWQNVAKGVPWEVPRGGPRGIPRSSKGFQGKGLPEGFKMFQGGSNRVPRRFQGGF